MYMLSIILLYNVTVLCSASIQDLTKTNSALILGVVNFLETYFIISFNFNKFMFY